MGWMIGASENPFTNIPLDVLIYDGIKDQELDGSALISPTSLAFNSVDLIKQFEGTESILTDQFTMNENWRAVVGVVGGPIQISFSLPDPPNSTPKCFSSGSKNAGAYVRFRIAPSPARRWSGWCGLPAAPPVVPIVSRGDLSVSMTPL